MLPLAAAVLAAWLYLLLARGHFWRFRDDPPPPPPTGEPPRVAAIIPARNEVAVVGRALASLAAQQYPGEFRIVLVDDASTDGTAEAARAAAPAVHIVAAAPLERGWSGKVWAMAEGIRHTGQWDPEYYLFTDADIVHPPDNLRTLVTRAAAGRYDLVSYMATLRCESPAERALIPAFVFFFFMLYPPRWILDARRATAGAAGGCILVRREALRRIGGIAAISGALIDDCALAAAVKRTGGRIWLGLGRETRSIRVYDTFTEVGRMVSRTAYTQLRHSAWLLAGTIAGMCLLYLAPPALALFASGLPRIVGALTWALLSVAYVPALRYYRLSPLRAPLLPLVAAFYTAATLHSAAAWWRGAGGLWKGRVHPTPDSSTHSPPMS